MSGGETAMTIKNEIKSRIIEAGRSMIDVVNEINEKRPSDRQTSAQNLSNKLTRETLKYKEAQEIADVIGYSIEWKPVGKK